MVFTVNVTQANLDEALRKIDLGYHICEVCPIAQGLSEVPGVTNVSVGLGSASFAIGGQKYTIWLDKKETEFTRQWGRKSYRLSALPFSFPIDTEKRI